jgi:rfaE bifunctional protein kinase chain/domain
MKFEDIVNKISNCKVGIVGDVMLDTYMWGKVDRISPEAPVPIVALHNKEYRVGGAANVALNTVALQAKTFLFSVIGDDDDGKLLLSKLSENNIEHNGIVQSAKRITTNKIRVIAKNQQMLRLDNEQLDDIEPVLEEKLFEAVQQFIVNEKPAILILEDYNKGVLTPTLIPRLISICKEHQVLVAVDPKRKNFFAYKGVNIFKPNLHEALEALNIQLHNTPDLNFLKTIHDKLHNILEHQHSIITLSEHGIFYHNNSNAAILPAHLRKISDVSGAGDTAIAVASLVYAITKNIEISAALANLAGGLVCEEVGTVPINKQKFLNELSSFNFSNF